MTWEKKTKTKNKKAKTLAAEKLNDNLSLQVTFLALPQFSRDEAAMKLVLRL